MAVERYIGPGAEDRHFRTPRLGRVIGRYRLTASLPCGHRGGSAPSGQAASTPPTLPAHKTDVLDRAEGRVVDSSQEGGGQRCDVSRWLVAALTERHERT